MCQLKLKVQGEVVMEIICVHVCVRYRLGEMYWNAQCVFVLCMWADIYSPLGESRVNMTQ